MDTQHPVPRRRIRPVTIALLSAGLAVVVAAGVIIGGVVSSGHSPGQLLAQAQGSVRFDDVDRASQLPEGVAPSWLPESARHLRMTRPGAASGLPDVRLSALVSGSSRVPRTCDPITDGTYSIPFDGAGEWPSLRSWPRYACGGWTLVDAPAAASTDGSRTWYLWRS